MVPFAEVKNSYDAPKGRFMDTSDILFIGCASFAGAGAPWGPNRREKLIQQGFLPEFVDRFGMILEFEALSKPDLETLLNRPQGLLAEYQELFNLDNVNLIFNEDAVHAIAEEACRRGGGARGLRIILEDIALDLSFEFFYKMRPLEFIVDKAFVSRSL
jgi:ATP-dependent Clp protease ATP-binding subunit ClpX